MRKGDIMNIKHMLFLANAQIIDYARQSVGNTSFSYNTGHIRILG